MDDVLSFGGEMIETNFRDLTIEIEGDLDTMYRDLIYFQMELLRGFGIPEAYLNDLVRYHPDPRDSDPSFYRNGL